MDKEKNEQVGMETRIVIYKAKIGGRNMSSAGKLTELIKTNFEYSSFILNLSYLRT